MNRGIAELAIGEMQDIGLPAPEALRSVMRETAFTSELRRFRSPMPVWGGLLRFFKSASCP